jgi:hypothetical protein
LQGAEKSDSSVLSASFPADWQVGQEPSLLLLFNSSNARCILRTVQHRKAEANTLTLEEQSVRHHHLNSALSAPKSSQHSNNGSVSSTHGRMLSQKEPALIQLPVSVQHDIQ